MFLCVFQKQKQIKQGKQKMPADLVCHVNCRSHHAYLTPNDKSTTKHKPMIICTQLNLTLEVLDLSNISTLKRTVRPKNRSPKEM